MSEIRLRALFTTMRVSEHYHQISSDFKRSRRNYLPIPTTITRFAESHYKSVISRASVTLIWKSVQDNQALLLAVPMALDTCCFWNLKDQNNFFSANNGMDLCGEPWLECTFNFEEIFPLEESESSLCISRECPQSAGFDLQTCSNNPEDMINVGSSLPKSDMNLCATEPDDSEFDGLDIDFEEVAIEGLQNEEEEAVNLPFSSRTDETESNRLTIQSYLKTWAEALEWDAWDLVKVIVDRLRQMVSPMGTHEERMAYYFLESFTPHENPEGETYRSFMNQICRQSSWRAFQALYELYPYARIAHFGANQSIVESVKSNHAKKLHIVDFDVMEGLQWPPLLESLGDESMEFLRITAIKWDDGHEASDPDRLAMSKTGSRLADCAASLGISFLYDEIRLPDLRNHIQEVKGEEISVVFNVMVGLPHMMQQRRKVGILEFLSIARGLQVSVLTFASAGLQSQCRNYAGHIKESMEYYSALLESVEAGLPEQGLARSVMEHSFVAPRIQRSVSASQWDDGELMWGKICELPRKCGFGCERVEISEENMRQAWEVVGLSRGSHYSLQREASGNEFVLKWRNTPLLSVSSWRYCHGTV